MPHSDILLSLAALLPLLACLLTLLRRSKTPIVAAYTSIGASLMSLTLTLLAIARRLGRSGMAGAIHQRLGLFCWLPLPGGYPPVPHQGLTFGVSVDSLSLVFFLLVLLLHLLSGVYSLSLLRQREIHSLYFAGTNLFTFSVLAMLISANILQLYAFLVLAGIGAFCVGFTAWRSDDRAAPRRLLTGAIVADALFLIGMGILLAHGPVSILTVRPRAGELIVPASVVPAVGSHAPAYIFHFSGPPGFLGLGWMDWVGICLLAGAMARSAQFPFHCWPMDFLPMPSPANALIGGALIAVCGPYLLARLFPLLNLNIRLVAAICGATTLTIAALVALVQTDIKRLVAWLLIAWTSLAFLLLGAGAYRVGVLESILACLAAATLFLVVGSVLGAVGGQRDIRLMGGLWAKLPVTAGAALLITMSATGLLALGGTPALQVGLTYLEHYASAIGGYGRLLFWAPALVGYLLPLAMCRWWWLVFAGRARSVLPAGVSESPVRTLPILLLTLGILTAQQPWIGLTKLLVRPAPGAFRAAIFPPLTGTTVGLIIAHLRWAWPAVLALIAAIYFVDLQYADRIRRFPGLNLIHRWLNQDMFFSDLYTASLGRPVRLLAQGFAFLDKWIVGWALLTGTLILRLGALICAAWERRVLEFSIGGRNPQRAGWGVFRSAAPGAQVWRSLLLLLLLIVLFFFIALLLAPHGWSYPARL